MGFGLISFFDLYYLLDDRHRPRPAIELLAERERWKVARDAAKASWPSQPRLPLSHNAMATSKCSRIEKNVKQVIIAMIIVIIITMKLVMIIYLVGIRIVNFHKIDLKEEKE